MQGTLTGILLGMGLGQLLVGPLADAVGRRRPLIAGLALHIAASVFCAFAPTIELLTVGPRDPGPRQRRGRRRLHGDGPRPVRRLGRGDDALAPHARHGPGPGARADPGRLHPPADLVARGVRHPRRRRGADGDPGQPRPARDPPGASAVDRWRSGRSWPPTAAAARPHLRRAGPDQRPDVRHAVLLHRRLVVRAAGHLRPDASPSSGWRSASTRWASSPARS